MSQKRQDIIQIRQSFCQRDKSLSSFLKLGNLSVTFWNNVKRFNKTIQTFWVQHILSVTDLLVLTDAPHILILPSPGVKILHLSCSC